LVCVFLALIWESAKAQYAFTCGLDGKSSIAYTKGDTTYICFHFMPFKVKMGFLIHIDEYTGIEVPDSFKFFENKPPEQLNIHAQLDVYSQYSPAALYLWKSAKQVVGGKPGQQQLTAEQFGLAQQYFASGIHDASAEKPASLAAFSPAAEACCQGPQPT